MTANAAKLLEYISERDVETTNHPFLINLNPLFSREEGIRAIHELETEGHIIIYEKFGQDQYRIEIRG